MKKKTTPDTTFQNEVHDIGKGTFTIIMYIFVALLIVGGTTTLYKIIFAPMLVAEKVMDADNILSNYEYYFDQNQAFIAINRKIDIVRQSNSVSAEFQLQGLLLQREDLMADYNSKSQQFNRNLFKDNSLPYLLTLPDTTITTTN